MKTLIAIPCMDQVQTLFFKDMLSLIRPEGTEVAISTSSLVYDSRNQLAKIAIDRGFDRVLWLDSDMTFEPDTLLKFAADLDEGLEYVSGLAFTRRPPIKACVYSECMMRINADGQREPTLKSFEELPEKPMFQVAASGLAAVMMTTSLIERVYNQFGLPFSPVPGFGEDLTFCMRASEVGAQLWCDSRIRLGHIGQTIFNYDTWAARG